MAKGYFRSGRPWFTIERRGTLGFGALVFGIYVDLGMALLFLVVMSFLWSLPMALILMPLMLFHEFGHAWGMRRYRIPVKGIYFLPPIGLAVVPDGPMYRRLEETDTALLGPAWGLVSALVAFGLWKFFGWTICAQIAMLAAYLNLFNLLRINPLDGGRVVKSIAWSVHPRVGIVIQGLGLLAGLWLLTQSVLLGLFVLYFGIREFLEEYQALRLELARRRVRYSPYDYRYAHVETGRPALTKGQVATRSLAYVGLAAALFGILYFL